MVSALFLIILVPTYAEKFGMICHSLQIGTGREKTDRKKESVSE